VPTITRIREATGAASVSFGVLHRGQVVMEGADGWRDGINKIPANVDTAYIIGSTMKAMMASCCGMLVSEGKLSWNEKLSQHLPSFHTVQDPASGTAQPYTTLYPTLLG
jgi:CubicO group peptidase (beta-lactamase class C family)